MTTPVIDLNSPTVIAFCICPRTSAANPSSGGVDDLQPSLLRCASVLDDTTQTTIKIKVMEKKVCLCVIVRLSLGVTIHLETSDVCGWGQLLIASNTAGSNSIGAFAGRFMLSSSALGR